MDIRKALDSLSCGEAKSVLLCLSEDGELRKKIEARLKIMFQNADATIIADEVFRTLNSILVEDLWQRSGETYYGYYEPCDEAHEMIEGAVNPSVRRMLRLGELGMNAEEEEYCRGIYLGLLRYGSQGTNDFLGWAPDSSEIIADNILEAWKDRNGVDETPSGFLNLD